MQNVTVDRNKYIGGSDIPIILGISPFKKRFDLLLEKAELKENEFKGNEYTEYGNVMEDKIRQHVNSVMNTNFVEDKKINGDIRCHVDGWNGELILEIKTTSQTHVSLDDYKVYLSQLLFYMENYGAENGVLAVYERPDDFNEEFDEKRLRVYPVNIDKYKEFVADINNAVEQFKVDLQKVKDNPFTTEEDLLPTDLTVVANQIVALECELSKFEELAKRRDELKEQLKKAMVENGVKKWTTPNNTQITLVADGEDKEVQKFNEKKFAEEHQDIYSEYLEAKVQKGRKGYVKITLPKEK
ncbi:MAG: YqaJ viral recombinase family protein [Bacilli bacterium]|nr:YqaJ viral recombinase family protein [Bacilli bacterium]